MENLKTAAKKIQEKGTDGDTILAHINPEEAQLLKMMGGSGTINPNTGLPEFKKFWKRITARNIIRAAPVILAIAAPGIGSAIGSAITGATVAGATEAAIGAAVMSGGMAAVQGKSPEEILKSAAAAGAGSLVGGAVSEAVGGGIAGGTTGGAASGATQAAIKGQDVGKGALVGGVTGGVGSSVQSALTPSTPTFSTPSGYGEGFDVTSGQTPAQVAAANPDLYPGGKLPPEGYETVYSPDGTVSYQDPSAFAKAAGKTAGQIAGQTLGSALYEKPKPTSTLSSTGLFTPQSIVPSGIAGIAPSPVATGRSISEGSEDEATGAWGAKTLRA